MTAAAFPALVIRVDSGDAELHTEITGAGPGLLLGAGLGDELGAGLSAGACWTKAATWPTLW